MNVVHESRKKHLSLGWKWGVMSGRSGSVSGGRLRRSAAGRGRSCARFPRPSKKGTPNTAAGLPGAGHVGRELTACPKHDGRIATARCVGGFSASIMISHRVATASPPARGRRAMACSTSRRPAYLYRVWKVRSCSQRKRVASLMPSVWDSRSPDGMRAMRWSAEDGQRRRGPHDGLVLFSSR